MPAAPRAALIDLETTPYYHCIARCVRRAFLCGHDPYSGESFEHRKAWLLERLRLVANVFTIDVCAYAIMSNHFHVVLRVDALRATRLTDKEVARRYGKLFGRVVRETNDMPATVRKERIALWRERLTSISWFMRVVNEYIARRANNEDKVTGRFWEGRFRSQALLGDAALLTCMSYVDLNPLRAKISSDIESSDFTSIRQRLLNAGANANANANANAKVNAAAPAKNAAHEPTLAPFENERGRSPDRALPIRLKDYAELLRWTANPAREKHGGTIKEEPPTLLRDKNIDPSVWLKTMTPRGLENTTNIGSADALKENARKNGKRWRRGQRWAAALFKDSA